MKKETSNDKNFAKDYFEAIKKPNLTERLHNLLLEDKQFRKYDSPPFILDDLTDNTHFKSFVKYH